MKMKRMFKKLLVMSLLVLALCGSALTVYADESDSSSTLYPVLPAKRETASEDS